MRARLAAQSILLAITGTLAVACHHPRAQTAITPRVRVEYDHCWWAAYRTAMSPDSVAARYARAYTTVGLANSGWAHLADTAWAEAGPTPLVREGGTRIYSGRVVAIRRGDTTFFRPFHAVRPDDGTGETGARQIGFCAEVSRAALTGGTAPRDEEPDDTLPLWRRRPTH
jgi:hypothetical protein